MSAEAEVTHLGRLFDAPLRTAPDRPAVIQDDVTLTYAALDARANRVAHWLRARGVRPGDRVALLFGNDHRFFELFFGVLRAGAVVLPLNAKGADSFLSVCVRDAEPALLVAGPGFGVRARGLETGGTAIAAVAEPDYEAALAGQPESPTEGPAPAGDALALILYTSGSTGRPKGVLLSHASQLWNTRVMARALGLDATDRALVAVPLFHKNALIAAVKPGLLVGAALVVAPRFEAVACLEVIARHRVTYLTGVPAMYQMLLRERDALARLDVSSVRYALCGSAPSPTGLLDEFSRVFGAPIAESYGLTEATNPLVNLRGEPGPRGSCGRPPPGGEVRLEPVDPGRPEVGELWLRSPGLASGYWRQESLWAVRMRDGWFRTGDLMRRDADGFHHFVGRCDEVINIAGEKIYPKEVEAVLLGDEAVAAAVVVPMPHPLKGEAPAAFVVARPGAVVDPERLRGRFFTGGGPAFAYPRRIEIVDALPLNGAGKPDRLALAAVVARFAATSALSSP